MTLLSFIFGRLAPRFRTVEEWAVIYRKLVDARPISAKTKANRHGALAHVLSYLGERPVSAVRPHEVAAMVQSIAATHPQTAKRVLHEVADLFNECMNYGWIDRNPAASVKPPPCRVQRKRLTLGNWQDLKAHAEERMPPWVSNMMILALVTGQRRSDLVKMQFDDVWDDHLHVEQAKTGTRLALPLALKLDAIGMTLAQAIERCKGSGIQSPYMLHKHNGDRLADASLSARFEEARKAVLPSSEGIPASLHECRSLSERLYRAQGIDTKVLLGHKHQAMTDIYNDDRGLTKGTWKTLVLT
jgi:enterobacteria phage integrase